MSGGYDGEDERGKYIAIVASLINNKKLFDLDATKTYDVFFAGYNSNPGIPDTTNISKNTDMNNPLRCNLEGITTRISGVSSLYGVWQIGTSYIYDFYVVEV